ncbi:transposase InsO family protein [Bradyrhizobium sp. SBR1B]|nr:transposase InsO family protein [Bradyrhizobium sp. SBR1B]
MCVAGKGENPSETKGVEVNGSGVSLVLWRPRRNRAKICSSQSRCVKLATGAGLRQRMRAVAEVRRRFGYRRLHVQLKREGYLVNHMA